IVMLTLALQMLANGIEMTYDQITKLNYLIVSNLGFKNCRLDTVDGVLMVHLGEFEYTPEDFSQNMKMVSILGNLKRVLDTPIYLKSQNDDDMVVVEDEMAGSYFIDAVLAMDQAVANDDNEELDMFKVLQDVIGDEQITSEEASGPIYLRDEPVRDVFNQLFKFTNKTAVSSVLCSLNKYVELVHSKLFDDKLINGKRIYDMFYSQSWLANSEQLATFKILPLERKQIYRSIYIGLEEHIAYLGAFLTKLSKHTSEWKPTEWDVNPVLNMISILIRNNPSHIKKSFEELKNALRGARIRMSRDTLIILLQDIEQKFDGTKIFQHFYFSNVSDNLFDDCVNFLESPPATKQYSEKEFKVGVCISQLAVSMCNQKYDLLSKIFLWQRSGELAYQSFVLIKIWTILCFKQSSLSTAHLVQQDRPKIVGTPRTHQRLTASLTMAERRFWNSIWPSMKKQLIGSIIGRDVQPNGIAYWEMFMDLITFLRLCGSDIIMLYSQEWYILLDSLEPENESPATVSFHQKVKQVRAMFDDPPLMMQEDTLSQQLFLEMRESMRLYCEINTAGCGRLF
ncbi:4707_t:CDS:2, partial [Gigaspora rosea]